jgi:hypothetical protein
MQVIQPQASAVPGDRQRRVPGFKQDEIALMLEGSALTLGARGGPVRMDQKKAARRTSQSNLASAGTLACPRLRSGNRANTVKIGSMRKASDARGFGGLACLYGRTKAAAGHAIRSRPYLHQTQPQVRALKTTMRLPY